VLLDEKLVGAVALAFDAIARLKAMVSAV